MRAKLPHILTAFLLFLASGVVFGQEQGSTRSGNAIYTPSNDNYGSATVHYDYAFNGTQVKIKITQVIIELSVAMKANEPELYNELRKRGIMPVTQQSGAGVSVDYTADVSLGARASFKSFPVSSSVGGTRTEYTFFEPDEIAKKINKEHYDKTKRNFYNDYATLLRFKITHFQYLDLDRKIEAVRRELAETKKEKEKEEQDKKEAEEKQKQVTDLLSEAQKALWGGDLQKAKPLLEKAYKLDPSNQTVQKLSGEYAQKKDEKAKKELDAKIAEGKSERETSAGSTQNTNNSYRYNKVSATQQKIAIIDKAHSEFSKAIDQVSESLRKESREHQQKSAAIWEDVLATEAAIKQSELEFEKREKERKEKKREEYKKIEQDEKKRLDITLNKREFGKYDEISEFSKEGLALVAVGSKTLKKYGYVNKNGEEVITLQYDWADNFKNGLAAVVLNGKGGFIDQNGKEVIPLKYDYVKSFSDGLALVNTGSTWLHGGHLVPKGKSGFIDKSGKEVIPLRYDYAEPFSEGLALVLIGDVTKLKGKWAFIDTTEDEVIPLKYNLAKSFSEGLAPVNIGFTLGENFNSGKWGYIDKNGNEVIPVKYDEVSLFSEGLARVKLKGRYGFINKKGQEVIPITLEYMSISDFSEGLAKVQKGSFPNYKYGFIDSTGKEIGTLEYDYAESFKNGKAKVKLDGREFYIDKTGKEVK